MKQNLTLYDFPQEALYFKQLCIFELTRILFKKLYIYIPEVISICLADVRAKYI